MPLSDAERDAYLRNIEVTVRETRDLARSTDQTLRELVVPSIGRVEEHEKRLNQAEGGMRLLGYLGAALTVALSVLAYLWPR